MRDRIRLYSSRSRSRLAFAVAASALLAACASLDSKPPRTANLSGDWQLDQALSEDPNGVLRQQHRGGRGGGGGFRHHGGGMSGGMSGGGMGGGTGGGMGMPSGGGGSSRGGGYGGGGRGARGGNGVLPDFMAQPAALSIRQQARQLALSADGVSTTFVYGEKVVASVQGGAAERVSGWKGNDFVVSYQVTASGPAATRSYEVGDGGRQLIVTTEVTGGRMPEFKLRTVYERAPTG
jgi:hypothetical protein